jgi:hypothetical protein
MKDFTVYDFYYICKENYNYKKKPSKKFNTLHMVYLFIHLNLNLAKKKKLNCKEKEVEEF